MSGWSNLSNELFRMSHNVNQTIWASGTGRKSYSGAMQGKPVIIKSAKLKKNKKFHKAQKKNGKTKLEKSQEEFLISEEPRTEESGQNPRSDRLEQQAAQMRARSKELQTAEQDIASAAGSRAGIRVNNPEELQTAVLWAEILGDPVSVRRRKKRMNQYYGN